MATTGSDRPETDFPRGIGAPATSALTAAGQHGVGPKALRVLGEALAERGLAPLG